VNGSTTTSRTVLARATPYLKSPLCLFIIVNVPFLLIFYDVWNLNTIFYAASYLAIGLNPYYYHNQIPGGLPLQFFGLVAYAIFRASQSNFLFTAAAVKVLFVALTYLTGVVLARVARLEGLPYHRKVLYAFIFNPFLLFINNIWVETDVIIIFLYVLGYAALVYGWDRGGELRYLVFGVLCLALAVLSYYSVVLLIPTLLVYREPLRKKFQLLVTFLVIGGLLSIPLVLFNLTALASLAAGTFMPSTGISPYSIFNLIVPLTTSNIATLELVALPTTFIAAILVPLVLKQRGATEPVSMVTSYAIAYLLFVNTIQGDNFVLLIGLVMLALISLRLAQLSYKLIFALQLFILPQFIIVEELNGISKTTGVFYWSYYQFYASPNQFALFGGTDLWHAMLIVYAILLVLTLAYFLVRRRRTTRPVPVGLSSPALSRSAQRSTVPHVRTVSIVVLVAVLLLTTALPLILVVDPEVGKPAGTIIGFDAGQFIPLQFNDNCPAFPQCAYQLASPSSYQVNGSSSTAFFTNTSRPLGLYRNMTDQSFTIGLAASVQWGISHSIGSVDVVNTSSFYAGQGDAVVVSNSSLLTPSGGSGFIPILRGVTTPILWGSYGALELNGNTEVTYSLNLHALIGRSVLFGAELGAHPPSQELLWGMFGTSISYEALLIGNNFDFGYRAGLSGNWHYNSSVVTIPPDRWFLTGLEVSPQGDVATAILDWVRLSQPFAATSSSNASLNIGRLQSPNPVDYPYQFTGLVTNLYSVPTSQTTYRQLAYAWSDLTGTLVTIPSVGPISVTISGTTTAPVLVLEGTNVFVGPFHDLWIGKLSYVPASVQISFGAVQLSSSSSGPNIELIVVDFAVLVPALITFWCFYPVLYRKLQGRYVRLARTRARVPARRSL
jgi:hypothetical protein